MINIAFCYTKPNLTMGKYTVYLSLKEGVLHYRDNDNKNNLQALPGKKIVWTLEENSGISDISGINIPNACDLLRCGPEKKSCTTWVARINKKASGQLACQLFVSPVEESSKSGEIKTKSTSSKDYDPPQIIIRI